MKKVKPSTAVTLAVTAVSIGITLCLVRRNKRKKRSQAIADAGYELAYDLISR